MLQLERLGGYFEQQFFLGGCLVGPSGEEELIRDDPEGVVIGSVGVILRHHDLWRHVS